MDYIYNGEVQLFQEDLDSFLDVAQKLKIDGLIGSNQVADKEENIDDKFSNEVKHEDVIEEVQPSEEVPKQERKARRQPTQSFAVSTLNSDTKEATDQLVIKNADNYECRSCGKTARTSSDIRRHVEVHIEGLSFECQTCGNTFRSRNALKTHNSKYH